MKLAVFFLATLVAFASSETALEEFAAGNLKFTARLYNEVLKAKPGQNFIFSPFSIEIIMALTQAGAKGQTSSEFSTALNFPSEQATEEAIKHLVPALKANNEDLKLLSANKIYLGKNFEILDSFKRVATDVFDSGIENVDFSKASEAAGSINQWVEHQTNDKIKDLISPDSLDSDTRMVLVNALYFSGKWETQFEDYLTRKDKFYISNTESKEVDMMQVEDSFRYYECAKCNAKFIELPYLRGNISMTIVLPNEREGLSALESNLEEVLAPKPLQYERVSVKMPKFLVESDLDLKPILINLGLETLFSNGADLSGISKEALHASEAIQKAFINVTESGTEAAAATALKFVPFSLPQQPVIKPKPFVVDHPAFYFIRHGEIILFAGKIYN